MRKVLPGDCGAMTKSIVWNQTGRRFSNRAINFKYFFTVISVKDGDDDDVSWAWILFAYELTMIPMATKNVRGWLLSDGPSYDRDFVLQKHMDE